MNKKDIVKDERLVIKMSKEEKELFVEYAKEKGIPFTRLARNILLEKVRKK